MANHPGETVRLKSTFKDFDKVLVNPTTHEIKIYDPTGALKETLNSATQISPGIWYVIYTIPATGKVGSWKCVWKGTFGSGPSAEHTIETQTFEVEKV